MTEQEWLEGDNPLKMVESRRSGLANERKLRLFGCACCRRVWGRLPGQASRDAVAVAERYADGLATRKDLKAAWLACGGDAPTTTLDPAHTAAQVSLKMAAFWTAYNAQCLAAWTGTLLASQIAAHQAAREAEGRHQGKLLHDIFGNPLRPATFSPAWQTTQVLALAQAAYEQRELPAGTLDATRLAVLADALEEAGCTDQALPGHLRGPGPHVRGCWAVDLVLGKS
jgi:hypothetical protein